MAILFFSPSLACYLVICSVDLVSLCLLSQWSCYADWVLFDLSSSSCLGQGSLLVCLLQASGLPWEELFWRDAEQYPSLLRRTRIQGSIHSLNMGRMLLLNPSAVISAGKAGLGL